MKNLKMTYTPMKTIKDIMSNINCPWRPTGCACAAVKAKLRAVKSAWQPPEVNGHVFFIGREYHGPRAAAMNMCSSNIPRATPWDWRNALESAFDSSRYRGGFRYRRYRTLCSDAADTKAANCRRSGGGRPLVMCTQYERCYKD